MTWRWFPFAIAALAVAVSCRPAEAESIPLERVLGTWRGVSVCTGTRPACKDERVRYHIARAPDGPWEVIQTAEKLVGASWDTMGVLEMKYDATRGTLMRELQTRNGKLLWRLRVVGDRMEGTLVSLPDSALDRVVEVARDTAAVAIPEDPDIAFAPLEFLIGGEWRSPQEQFFSRTYEWRNDRVAMHFRRNLATGFFAYDPVNRKLVEWQWLTPNVRTRREFTSADAIGFTVADESSRTTVRHTGPDSFTEINHSPGTLSKAATSVSYSRERP